MAKRATKIATEEGSDPMTKIRRNLIVTSAPFAAVLVLGLLFAAMAQGAFAQSAPPSAEGFAASQGTAAHDATTDATHDKTNTSAANNSTAAILDELEKMRARIAELEAQLRQQLGNIAAASAIPSSQPPATSASVTSAPASSAPAYEHIPQTSQVATAEKKLAKVEPFSDADWTWLNGNPRTKDEPLDTKFFTPEIRADTVYVFDFNRPTDHSIGGSSELFRSQEVQLTQLGVGGDFHYDNVR
ncbi:MAG: hypothetical protein WA766_00275, partial [Candidatus Acidiferrales bacterium]